MQTMNILVQAVAKRRRELKGAQKSVRTLRRKYDDARQMLYDFVICGNEEELILAMQVALNGSAPWVQLDKLVRRAARLGYVNALSLGLTEEATIVDSTNANGDAVLHIACENGHACCVSKLISAKADVNIQSQLLGRTALHISCANNRVECVRLLLAAEADVELVEDGDGFTSLHDACWSGNHECATLLIRYGADVNKTNLWDENALMMACRYNHVECIDCLLRGKALTSMKKGKNATAMYIACKHGSLEAVKLLCLHGCGRSETDIAIAEARRHSHLLEWLSKTAEFTTIHFIEELSTEAATTLLRRGCDIFTRPSPRTPSPLERAHQLENEVSRLILLAAEPWAAANHHLFPQVARNRAVTLFYIGLQIARIHGRSMYDVWVAYVIPASVSRSYDTILHLEPRTNFYLPQRE